MMALSASSLASARRSLRGVGLNLNPAVHCSAHNPASVAIPVWIVFTPGTRANPRWRFPAQTDRVRTIHFTLVGLGSLLSLQKDRGWEPGTCWRIERSLERDRNVRAALNALWLHGFRTPAHWRYGVGILAALLASLARIALNPFWGTSFPYILFFPTTLFTALFAGLGPAWVGIVISAVMTLAWVLPPTGVDHIYLVGLTTYVVVDGAVAWIGSAHRALTEQSERQTAELEAREQDLRRAVVEAETANQAKDDFLAVLSHELRTPLTTIVAGVRVLHHIGSPEESASRTRESIERQADHLVRLVDDLLDMKRIVSGAVALERRPCDLGDAVADVIAVLNDAGRFKAHVLSLDTEPVWVNGDVMRLQQITTNLLGNAVK